MPTSFSDPPGIGDPGSIIFITQTRADLPADVYTGGNVTTVFFEYGKTVSYGNTKSINLGNTSAYGTIYTSATITDLSPGTLYHYRVRASNYYGTDIGPDIQFTTLRDGENGILFNSNLSYGTLNDISGNTYKTIQIGTQTWMAENLRVTRFNDSTPIPLVTSNVDWAKLTTPAYCWFENDSSTYKMSNGALYNWFAVEIGKLCPTGWHVPSDLEWTTLIYSLGGNYDAIGKLQEAGTAHWADENPIATNSSGFTALPCGDRSRLGLGHEGRWWSSVRYPAGSDITLTGAWELALEYRKYGNTPIMLKGDSYQSGLSVRCLKD